MMYQRILVPLEHTPYDDAILAHVRGLARLCNASLVFILVADGFAARNLRTLDLRESEVIREDRDRNDFERSCRMRGTEGCPQVDDVLDKQPPTPLQEIDREEIRATRHLRAEVIRHTGKLMHRLPKRNQPNPQRHIRKAPRPTETRT